MKIESHLNQVIGKPVKRSNHSLNITSESFGKEVNSTHEVAGQHVTTSELDPMQHFMQVK